MDVQIQELIDKIKKDGIATAESEADKIVKDAEAKAVAITNEAQQKADEIIKSAKKEAEKLQKSSEEAIVQAGRNLLLSFKDSIINELNGIILAETQKAESKDILVKLVPETVRAWAKNSEVSELSVLLSEKDLKAMESSLVSELKAEISKGLEIKTDKTLSAGFRIGVKDGAAYYDYSADSLAEMFAAYLNPKVAELIKVAAKDAK